VAAASGAKTITALETEEQAEGKNIVEEPTLPASQTAGVIVTLRKRLNAFLRWDTETNTRTATAQAAAGADKTMEAFESVGTVEGKNIVTEPTLPESQTAGFIVTLRKRLNAFMRWDTETQTRTAVTVAAASASKTITTGMTEEQAEGRNIVEEPTLPASQTPGVIVTLRKRLNAFLRWDTETTTQTRHDNSLAGALVEKTPTVSSLGDVIDGQTAVPTALGANDYGSLEYRKDGFGRYVGHRIIRTYTDTYIIWGETTGTSYSHKEDEYAHMYSATAKRVRRYVRTVTFSGTSNIRNSYTAALALYTGSGPGSKIESHGSGRYIVFLITTITRGNWALDETGVS
jgi:uncharacterized membrane protein